MLLFCRSINQDTCQVASWSDWVTVMLLHQAHLTPSTAGITLTHCHGPRAVMETRPLPSSRCGGATSYCWMKLALGFGITVIQAHACHVLDLRKSHPLSGSQLPHLWKEWSIISKVLPGSREFFSSLLFFLFFSNNTFFYRLRISHHAPLSHLPWSLSLSSPHPCSILPKSIKNNTKQTSHFPPPSFPHLFLHPSGTGDLSVSCSKPFVQSSPPTQYSLPWVTGYGSRFLGTPSLPGPHCNSSRASCCCLWSLEVLWLWFQRTSSFRHSSRS